MQISSLWAGRASPDPRSVNPEIASAAAVVNNGDGSQGLDQQLQAYQTLAAHWGQPGASPADRTVMSQAITQSPFAQRVESALNSFTKAAWSGQGASAATAQRKMIEAFDVLPQADQQIVSTVQASVRGQPAFTSMETYRASLQANLDLTLSQAAAGPADSVTLSPDAQARLAGEAEPLAPAPAPNAATARSTPQSLAMAQAAKAYTALG